MAKSAIITRNYQDHAINYQEDGWFNATQAAKKFGKEPHEWMRLATTESYMEALGKALGFEPGKSRNKLTTTSKVRGQAGTWLHPKMAVAFARWLDDDFAVWCDLQIDDIVRGKDDWAKSRHITAVSYKAMSAVLQEVRAEDGKETKAHHYANEARLVNWALTGEFCAIDRETLSRQELDLLGALEVKDIALIGRGRTYEERKVMLKLHADTLRTRQAQKLSA